MPNIYNNMQERSVTDPQAIAGRMGMWGGDIMSPVEAQMLYAQQSTSLKFPFNLLGDQTGGAVASMLQSLGFPALKRDPIDVMMMQRNTMASSAISQMARERDITNLQNMIRPTMLHSGLTDTEINRAVRSSSSQILGLLSNPRLAPVLNTPIAQQALDIASGGGLFSILKSQFSNAAGARLMQQSDINGVFDQLSNGGIADKVAAATGSTRGDVMRGLSSALRVGMVGPADLVGPGGVTAADVEKVTKQVTEATMAFKRLFGANMPMDQLLKTVAQSTGQMVSSFSKPEFADKINKLAALAMSTGVSPEQARAILATSSLSAFQSGYTSAIGGDMAGNIFTARARAVGAYNGSSEFFGKMTIGEMQAAAMQDMDNLSRDAATRNLSAIVGFMESGNMKKQGNASTRQLQALRDRFRNGTFTEADFELMRDSNQVARLMNTAGGSDVTYSSFMNTAEADRNIAGATAITYRPRVDSEVSQTLARTRAFADVAAANGMSEDAFIKMAMGFGYEKADPQHILKSLRAKGIKLTDAQHNDILNAFNQKGSDNKTTLIGQIALVGNDAIAAQQKAERQAATIVHAQEYLKSQGAYAENPYMQNLFAALSDPSATSFDAVKALLGGTSVVADKEMVARAARFGVSLADHDYDLTKDADVQQGLKYLEMAKNAGSVEDARKYQEKGWELITNSKAVQAGVKMGEMQKNVSAGLEDVDKIVTGLHSAVKSKDLGKVKILANRLKTKMQSATPEEKARIQGALEDAGSSWDAMNESVDKLTTGLSGAKTLDADIAKQADSIATQIKTVSGAKVLTDSGGGIVSLKKGSFDDDEKDGGTQQTTAMNVHVSGNIHIHGTDVPLSDIPSASPDALA